MRYREENFVNQVDGVIEPIIGIIFGGRYGTQMWIIFWSLGLLSLVLHTSLYAAWL